MGLDNELHTIHSADPSESGSSQGAILPENMILPMCLGSLGRVTVQKKQVDLQKCTWTLLNM